MLFHQLITSQNTYIDNLSKSKTAVLKKISQVFCETTPELEFQSLFDAYWKREDLGSTAIGDGILIPHLRLCALRSPKACFIKLTHPVDFRAKDKQLVDLVIGLLAPLNQSQQHLTILSNIVQQFSDPEFCKACRKQIDSDSLYQLIKNKSLLLVEV